MSEQTSWRKLNYLCKLLIVGLVKMGLTQDELAQRSEPIVPTIARTVPLWLFEIGRQEDMTTKQPDGELLCAISSAF